LPSFVAVKAAAVAVHPTKEHPMFTNPDDAAFEPEHSASPTDTICTELQLFGYRHSQNDPDPRTVPEDHQILGAVSDIFDALVATIADTSLDADLDELFWSTVNMFHRATDRIERRLDDNEQAQRRGQREQDGSEVKAVALEHLIAVGQSLLDRRDCMEIFRDTAADHYLRLTGSPWAPRSGSRVNHGHLTSAMIDSRDFLAARRHADAAVHLPKGTKIAFTGGLDFNDHRLIWDTLDKVHAKHSDMILLHGGSPKGTELIAAKWAETRTVPQVVFKPDWTKHAKAAPFKRNDQILDVLPIGVIIFPGSGIQDNFADKARKLGIRAYDFRRKGGA
jgi:YspA, cpYpsA-related SLOG family